MAKKKDVIGQAIKIIARVEKGEVKTTKNGLEIIELTLKTPEGILLKIARFVKENDLDFIVEQHNQFKDIIERVENEETIYVMKNIYVNKKGKQYDFLTSHSTDEGKIYYQTTGGVQQLSFEATDEGDIIEYKNFDTTVNRKFEDIKNTIKITMYANDKTYDTVTFSDNDENYPKEITISVSNTDNVKLGTAYDISLKFIKGKLIKDEDMEQELDWGATTAKGGRFENDKLIPIAVRIADIDPISSDAGDDEFPF